MGAFPIQNSFTTGIVSRALWGRVDLPQYMTAAADIKNFLVRPWGGLTRRGGLFFGWQVKDDSVETRLLPFRYANGDAFIIEAGPGYFRFGKNGTLIRGSAAPIEIETPYSESQVAELWISQSADVIWICHPEVAPRKLLRYSDIEWYLAPVTFVDGPYLSVNTTDTTLVSDVETGTATITAANPAAITGIVSARSGTAMEITTDIPHGLVPGDVRTISGVVGTVEANTENRVLSVTGRYSFIFNVAFVNPYVSGGTISEDVFVDTDVGRLIRIWYDDTTNDPEWGWGEITDYTSGSVVVAEVVEGKFPTGSPAAATVQWKLGKFSETTGWPATVALHQQRIAYAGAKVTPLDIDLSQVDLVDFFQVARDLSVVPTDAISYRLFSQQVNPVNWMIPMKGGLGIGTAGGCWLFGAGPNAGGLSATDLPVADEHVGVGTARLQPQKAGNVALFVEKTRRRVHEFAYVFEDDSYQAPDLMLLAEHLTMSTKIKEIAWQQSDRILWVLLEDGQLIGLTYLREEKVVAWHRAETAGLFKSMAVVPDGDRDVLYVVAEREVDGSTVRYVEFMADIFRGAKISDGFFLDAGITGDLADDDVAVTDASQADPVRLEIDSTAELNSGDTVLVDEVLGMTELNGNHYAARVIDGATVDLYDETTIIEELVRSCRAADWVAQRFDTIEDDDAIGAVAVIYGGGANGGSFTLDGVNVAGSLIAGKTYRLFLRAYAAAATGIVIKVYSTVSGSLDVTTVLTTTPTTYMLEFVADAGTHRLDFDSSMVSGDIAYIEYDSIRLAEHDATKTVDGTAFTAYTSAGLLRAEERYVQGLDHLEGEDVLAVADGKLLPVKTVASGAIDLGYYAKNYQVGLTYTSRVESLPAEMALKSGTTIGRTKSINRIIARIFDSYYYRCGLIVDGIEQPIDEVPFTEDTVFGEEPALFTGEKDLYPEGTYGTGIRYVIETDLPAPLNLSAVVYEFNQESE